MPQYLIAVYHDDISPARPRSEMEPIWEAVGALNDQAVADGIFVFAGGLARQGTETVVDARTGTPVVTDGPYVETKEYMGGFWVIDVPDLDAAVAWAQLATVACQQPLGIRAFLEMPEGAGDA